MPVTCCLCGRELSDPGARVATHASQLSPPACQHCLRELPAIVAGLRDRIAALESMVFRSSDPRLPVLHAGRGGSAAE